MKGLTVACILGVLSLTAWESFDRPDARRFTPPAPGELLDWVLVIRKAN